MFEELLCTFVTFFVVYLSITNFSLLINRGSTPPPHRENLTNHKFQKLKHHLSPTRHLCKTSFGRRRVVRIQCNDLLIMGERYIAYTMITRLKTTYHDT